MLSKIVKAATERSKYIVDVYYYGITCKKCTYDYTYYAMEHFISQCEDRSCDSFTNISLDTVLDCSSSVDFIPNEICVPASEVIDCNKEYKTIKSVGIEYNPYLTTRLAAGDNLYFTFTSLIVNGVEYLNGSRTFLLNNSNVTTQVVNGTTVITNPVTWLNSFNLPDIVFAVSDVDRILITFPSNTTFQITTDFNDSGDEYVYGVILDQTGITGVRTFTAIAYYTSFTGSYSIWGAETELIRQGTLC